MNKQGILARVAAGAAGSVLLIGVAGVAFAAEEKADDHDVNVTVDIAAVEPVGALTLTVGGTSAALTEITATDDEKFREFTGTLPSVTVSDDRTEIPAGAFWYVNGQSSDFTAGGGLAIGAENLGWTPALTEGDESVISLDGGTVPELDDPTNTPAEVPNNVGLKSAELLALALDATAAEASGTWSANAALKLKTLADVAPGNYAAKITLTLWSDVDTTTLP